MSRFFQWFCLIFSLCLLTIVGRLQEQRKEASMWLAFVTQNKGGTEKVSMMWQDGTWRQDLTDDQHYGISIKWSSDGTALALFSTLVNLPATELQIIKPNQESYIVNFIVLPDNYRDVSLEWTPDSNYILLIARDETNGYRASYLVKQDGSAREIVSPYQVTLIEQTLSPNGEWFAYTMYDVQDKEKSGTYLRQWIDTEGQKIFDQFGYNMSWSPDNQWLWFFTYDGANETLWRVHRDNARLEKLNEITLVNEGIDDTRRRTLQWLPDGKWVYWTRCETACEIVKMSADGRETHLTPLVLENISQISLSPDGKWFAFHMWQNNNAEVFIMHPDGTELHQLTHTLDANEYNPQWSPLIGKSWHQNILVTFAFIGLGVVAVWYWKRL
jgi:Tol biopolymer transport system component